ncbi:organ-specific protein P4-like [Cornus florida]|uniref:organ-specific protein P4-like n=1 Tax=Cornus florida TaxID=4283 RepID=UPI00289C7A2C|nr:organ-specific protein P4-like [Cornus florida]
MESCFAFFILFSLVLFATTIDARKDPGEYWQGIMKDQPMPEAIQGLVYKGSLVLPLSNKKTDCHTSSEVRNVNAHDHIVKDSEHAKEQPFVKDFNPQPSATVYRDDTKLSAFVKDFDPQPSTTVYRDDTKLSAFVKDFEPQTSVKVYRDDTKLSAFVKDFEPQPSVTIYRDDTKLSTFVRDFDPQPSATVYRNDDKLTEEKSFVKTLSIS